ncbi:MAG: glycosyltransferase [Planctomycetaceae bacterium]
MSNETAQPLVSVMVLAYRHQDYIDLALRSILCQQTDFPVEVLVGEDCSPDATRDRIRAIDAESPGRLTLHLHERNLGMAGNFLHLLNAAQGKYVAILEGDDYWTDPLKLQRQVDVFEQHPEWAICFHRVQLVNDRGEVTGAKPAAADFPTVTGTDDLLRNNFISTPSVMFRNRLFDRFPEPLLKLPMLDWPLHLLNAQRGQVGFLDQSMAAYRDHAGGQWGGRSLQQRYRGMFDAYDAFEDYFGEQCRATIREARKAHLDDLSRELQTLQQSTSLRVGQRIVRTLRFLTLRGTK